MRTLKLTATDAFVVVDLDDAPAAVGMVRLAPKLLVDGAVWLARSLTYQFALLEAKVSGASAGVNAGVESRAEALDAFTSELVPEVASGRLSLHPGKGVAGSDLAALRAVEAPRSPALWDDLARLTARSAVVAAGAVDPLPGRSVAIEHLDETGVALAAEVVAAGGRIVAVATPSGAVTDPTGFEPALLAEAVAAHGAAAIDHLGVEPAMTGAVLGAPAEVLFVGSKAGALSHEGAARVQARVVVPTGPVPVTARAYAALQRAGVTVLPCFLATAGVGIAHLAGPEVAISDVLARIDEVVGALARDLVRAEEPPLLAGCRRAEVFLDTWTTRPFGRPLG